MQTPRNLIHSLPTLVDFEVVQQKIKEAEEKNQTYHLSAREVSLCKPIMEERAEVSSHNVSRHFRCCKDGDEAGAKEYHSAFCIDPYKAVMIADYQKKFGEINYTSPSASWEKEFA